MSVSGLPNLPGTGSGSPPPPLPAGLGPAEHDPLPPPSALPSPVRDLPPLSPQGAGVDSPGGGTPIPDSDGQQEDTGESSGGGDAPAAPGETDSEQLGPRTSMPPKGGIEHGLGGSPLPSPRTVPESDLNQRGPGRTSDTPPLPRDPPTPQDPPVLRREKHEQQQLHPPLPGEDDSSDAEVGALPPPPGSDLEKALREVARRGKWHRTEPDEAQHSPDRNGTNQGGVWRKIKGLFGR